MSSGPIDLDNIRPVGYRVEKPLTALPAGAFNHDGIAVVFATGTSYGREWLINLLHGPVEDNLILGSIWTDHTENPDVAAATALAWLTAELPNHGLKVPAGGFVCHNDRYGPNERPYFTTSQVCIVGRDWV